MDDHLVREHHLFGTLGSVGFSVRTDGRTNTDDEVAMDNHQVLKYSKSLFSGLQFTTFYFYFNFQGADQVVQEVSRAQVQQILRCRRKLRG